MLGLIIVTVVALVIAIWWGLTYQQLVELESQVDQALGTLAAQLRQRINLIPDILKAAREAVNFQMKYFNQILELRKQIHHVRKRSGTEDREMPPELRALDELAQNSNPNHPVCEDNPQMDVKTYEKLQEIIRDTEKDIAGARRFVEDAKAQYNSAVRSFPGSLVASNCGFSPLPTTQIDSKLDRKPDYW